MSANFLRASATLALGLCFCPLTLQELLESEAALGGVCSPHFPSGVPGEAQPLLKAWQGAAAQAGILRGGRGSRLSLCTARGNGAFGSGLLWDQPPAEGAGQVACYQLTAVGKVKLTLLNKKWENALLSLLRRGASGCAAGPAAGQGAQHQLLARQEGSLWGWASAFKGDALRGAG